MTVAGAIGAVAGLGAELLDKIPDPDPTVGSMRVRARVARLTLAQRLRLLDEVRVAREKLIMAQGKADALPPGKRRDARLVQVRRFQARVDVLAAQLEAVDAHELTTATLNEG